MARVQSYLTKYQRTRGTRPKVRVDQTLHAASNASTKMFSHSSTVASVRDGIIIIGRDDIHIATFRAGLYYIVSRPSRACALLSIT
jgi:hypothetical protein